MKTSFIILSIIILIVMFSRLLTIIQLKLKVRKYKKQAKLNILNKL